MVGGSRTPSEGTGKGSVSFLGPNESTEYVPRFVERKPFTKRTRRRATRPSTPGARRSTGGQVEVPTSTCHVQTLKSTFPENRPSTDGDRPDDTRHRPAAAGPPRHRPRRGAINSGDAGPHFATTRPAHAVVSATPLTQRWTDRDRNSPTNMRAADNEPGYGPRPPRDTPVNTRTAATTQPMTQYMAKGVQRQGDRQARRSA